MKIILATLLGTAALASSQAWADDSWSHKPQKDWFVKLGASYVMPNSSGQLGPNTITAGNAPTATVEAGMFLNDRLSLSLTGGIPVVHEIYANGVDTKTTDTLGAVAVTGQFHLFNDDKFDAYVGGGLAYNIYFGTTSATTAGIDNGFAPVLQAGVEYKASESIGLFFDAKKEFYTTTIRRSSAPTSFSERLDPLVLTAGLAFHF